MAKSVTLMWHLRGSQDENALQNPPLIMAPGVSCNLVLSQIIKKKETKVTLSLRFKNKHTIVEVN